MNIGGMGTLELIIVFLIAFIFLGPQRMADAAKFLGKLIRDVKHMTAEIPDLVLDDDGKVAASSPASRRRGTPEPAPSSRSPDGDRPPQDDRQPTDQDAPVAFRPGAEQTPDDDESTPTRDRP